MTGFVHFAWRICLAAAEWAVILFLLNLRRHNYFREGKREKKRKPCRSELARHSLRFRRFLSEPVAPQRQMLISRRLMRFEQRAVSPEPQGLPPPSAPPRWWRRSPPWPYEDATASGICAFRCVMSLLSHAGETQSRLPSRATSMGRRVAAGVPGCFLSAAKLPFANPPSASHVAAQLCRGPASLSPRVSLARTPRPASGSCPGPFPCGRLGFGRPRDGILRPDGHFGSQSSDSLSPPR